MEEGARKRQGGRGYREWRGDPIIPRRCHEIASELYSIRVARPIARPSRTLEETLLHFGLSRPGLNLSFSLSRSRSWYLSFSLSHTNRYDRTSSKRRDWTEKNRPPPSNRRPLNSETCIAEKNLTRIRIPRSCLSRVFSKLVVEILDKLSFPRICFHLTRDESWDLLSREGCHVKILISSD